MITRSLSSDKHLYNGRRDDTGNKYGYGRKRYSNGDSYVGYWLNNVRHGHGTYTYGNTNESICHEFQNGYPTFYNRCFKDIIFDMNEKVVLSQFHKQKKYMVEMLSWLRSQTISESILEECLFNIISICEAVLENYGTDKVKSLMCEILFLLYSKIQIDEKKTYILDFVSSHLQAGTQQI